MLFTSSAYSPPGVLRRHRRAILAAAMRFFKAIPALGHAAFYPAGAMLPKKSAAGVHFLLAVPAGAAQRYIAAHARRFCARCGGHFYSNLTLCTENARHFSAITHTVSAHRLRITRICCGPIPAFKLSAFRHSSRVKPLHFPHKFRALPKYLRRRSGVANVRHFHFRLHNRCM